MGARVVILGRNKDRLSETRQLMDDPERHTIQAVDLLEYGDVSLIVREIVIQEGRIDGLINCAGISTTLPVNAVTTEKMEYFLRTNVIGGINLTKQVVSSACISASGGSVVFISSVMGVVGESGKMLYSMSKGALISAVKSLSVELAQKKIRVNSVSPGVVDTPMSKSAVYSKDEESLNRVRAYHPLGLGRPEDVANACVFLLSDAARWITGTNLVVDGGYLAK